MFLLILDLSFGVLSIVSLVRICVMTSYGKFIEQGWCDCYEFFDIRADHPIDTFDLYMKRYDIHNNNYNLMAIVRYLCSYI